MNGAKFEVTEFEVTEGYSIITNKEYKDLIETSIYYDEIINENEKLLKEIRELQEFMLEENIDNYYLKKGTMEEVTNLKDYYFPFTKEFIEKINMPMKDVIEFIRVKKTALLEKEKEEQENE